MKRTNKIKARKMWATADYADATNDSQNGGVEYEIGKVAPMDLPVSVLPRTKEAAEAMVEQGARALYDHHRHFKGVAYKYLPFHAIDAWEKESYESRARAVLRTLGLLP
jgi:hypothetical protein